jgi:hypothetical protein
MKRFSLTLASAVLLLAGPSALGSLPGMKVLKLASRGHENFSNLQFGHAVALSDTYAIVSERGFDTMSPKAGAVHVFNAATGAFLRTLRPATSTPNDGFGYSLALHGSNLLVGAYQQMSGTGAAYLFDLPTGRQIATYPGPFAGSTFGFAVALSDSLAVISAPEMNNQRGILRIIPLDGSPSVDFLDSTGNSMDKLGQAITLHGSRIAATTQTGKIVFLAGTTAAGVVYPSIGNALNGAGTNLVSRGFDLFLGAPEGNNGASNSGAVARLSHLNTSSTLIPIDTVPSISRRLGSHIAVERNLLATFANVSNGRAIVLHDLNRRQNLLSIDPHDLGTSNLLDSLALAGGRLLVGVPSENHLATESGAAYLVQNIPHPAPFKILASRGDQAPGAPDISWNTFGDSAITPSGLSVTRATLSGKGSNRGTDSGLYCELGHPGYFDSVAKSRQAYFGSALFKSLGSPVSNDPSNTLFSASLSGPAVTSANNTALFADSTTGFVTLARKGGSLFPLPQITIASLGQAAQSTTANRVAVRLDLSLAPAITTPLNDSAIALQTHAGVNAELLREDSPIGGGVNLGQIAPRVSFHSNAFFLSTTLRGSGITPANDAALLQKKPAGALTTLALEGASLPKASALRYAGFIGEGGSSTHPCIRALISSDIVTPATNEAIVFNNGTGLDTIAIKGQSDRVRFLRMWPMGDRLLIHMIITGPGITSANNEVLDLYQENNFYSRLLQKGKPLPGTNGLPIAAIQRVEVSNTSGHYAVLASLRGAPASSNQILLRGDLTGGLPTENGELSLRRPTIVLRKGQTHLNGFLGSHKITSLAFAHSNTMDVTGVGRKGLASVISSTGSILLRATFSDRSSRLIRLD